MTFTAQEVITQARIRLADTDGQKWPDNRMIYLLNEGLEELALRTRLFVKRGFVPVRTNAPFYNLGNNILKLARIAYKDVNDTDSVKLPFISHAQMDELGQRGGDTNNYSTSEATSPYSDFGFHVGVGWDNDTGSEPRAVIVSHQQPGNFRLYPIPVFQEATTTTAVPLAGSGEEGVVDGVRALAANPIDTIQASELMSYGASDVNLPDRYLIVHYIEVPERATALTKTYSYNVQYRKPIENYIVAKALRDDNDTYDAARAEREWDYFTEAVEMLEEQKTNDFRAPSITRMQYRPID